MSAPKTFHEIGAWLCAFLGAWCVWLNIVFARQVASMTEALMLIPFILYALLAFVPFIVFVYPRFTTARRLVFWSVSLLEIVVFGLFLCAMLFLGAATR